MVNEAQIETVVETPDTVITMQNGHNYIVKETIDEIYQSCVDFNRLSRRMFKKKDRMINGKNCKEANLMNTSRYFIKSKTKREGTPLNIALIIGTVISVGMIFLVFYCR